MPVSRRVNGEWKGRNVKPWSIRIAESIRNVFWCRSAKNNISIGLCFACSEWKATKASKTALTTSTRIKMQIALSHYIFPCLECHLDLSTDDLTIFWEMERNAALGPYDALDEVDEARNVRVHAIRACKPTELAERRDSDNVVHAVGLAHHDLQRGWIQKKSHRESKSMKFFSFAFFQPLMLDEMRKKSCAKPTLHGVPFVFNESVTTWLFTQESCFLAVAIESTREGRSRRLQVDVTASFYIPEVVRLCAMCTGRVWWCKTAVGEEGSEARKRKSWDNANMP